MSMTLLSILLAILFAELVVLLVFYQNGTDQLKNMQFSLGAEMKTAEKKIEAIKATILTLHERIDDARVELDELGEE